MCKAQLKNYMYHNRAVRTCSVWKQIKLPYVTIPLYGGVP